MLLAAAGGVDHQRLVGLAEKYFGHIEHGGHDVLDYEKGKFSSSYVGLIVFAILLHSATLAKHPRPRHGINLRCVDG